MTDPERAAGLGDDPVVLVLDLPGGPLAVEITGGSEGGAALLAQELRRLWAHVLLDVPPGEALDTVRVAGTDLPTDAERDAELLAAAVERATYAASGRVTRALLGRLVGTAILLHAGTVHREDSGTTTVIGPSGAGKSTAVSVLGRGETYLSDELTILDRETFAITGYPKPVSRAAPAGHKRDVALDDLDLTPTSHTSAPDQILLLSRDPERTGTAQLTRCGLASAIVRITEQTSSLWRLPDPLGTLARLLDAVGGALDAQYADAADLPALLRTPPDAVHEDWAVIDPRPEQLGEQTREVDGGDVVVEPASPQEADDPDPPLAGSDTVAVQPFRQGLVTSSGTVVLRADSIMQLDGLSALSWETLADNGPLTIDGLTERLVSSIGEHPEAGSLTMLALHRLKDGGLIARV